MTGREETKFKIYSSVSSLNKSFYILKNSANKTTEIYLNSNLESQFNLISKLFSYSGSDTNWTTICEHHSSSNKAQDCQNVFSELRTVHRIKSYKTFFLSVSYFILLSTERKSSYEVQKHSLVLEKWHFKADIEEIILKAAWSTLGLKHAYSIWV